MITGQQIVDWASQFIGKIPYRYGTEQDGRTKPTAEDCSELVQNDCDQNGVVPPMPDGSINQYHHCRQHGTLIPIKLAMKIPGALIFRIGVPGLENHVVISRGDGYTVEARGKRYGVGSWSVRGRTFNYAALIPGVTYPEIKEEEGVG